jgi:hypothetical protein
VAAGAELTNTGRISHSQTVAKTGVGLWRNTAGEGGANAASILNVNAGTMLLTDIFSGVGDSGDLNATAINVHNGGTLISGSSSSLAFGGETPRLGRHLHHRQHRRHLTWNIGEDYGGINLFGGRIGIGGNIDFAGVNTSEIQSGTIWKVGGSPGIGAARMLNKTTPVTVTITVVALNSIGGLNIEDGILTRDTAIASTSDGNTTTAAAHCRSARARPAARLPAMSASPEVRRWPSKRSDAPRFVSIDM